MSYSFSCISKGKLLATYLVQDKDFKGIGPRRSNALLSLFGDKLRDAILSTDQRVVDIIGEVPAINASVVLQSRLSEIDLLEWLYETNINLPRANAIRIARAWGSIGLHTIQKNPYLLLGVSNWSDVDRVAKANGISDFDRRRQIGAVEATLTGQHCLGSGATSISIHSLISSISKLLGYPVSTEIIEEAVKSRAAVKIGNYIQPPGAAYMEAQCALFISQMANRAPVSGVSEIQFINEAIDRYEKGLEIKLSKAQQAAIRMSHQQRLMVLAGFAGSGKTTVLRGICETLEAFGKQTLIITLSGRAAQRAAEATGRRSQTVARFLMESSHGDTPLSSNSVLIVDEASMLGLVEVWRILRKLCGANLILCGDPAQLPPVSSGVVFHTLAYEGYVPRVVLDRVHRQDESTGIPAIAAGMREGKVSSMPSFSGTLSGVTFTECEISRLCEKVLKIGLEFRKSGILRSDIQIIAPTNREIIELNSFFHRLLLTKKGNALSWYPHLVEGEPVIWTKNDPDRNLTNGALGRVVMLRGSDAIAEFDGVEHTLTPNDSQHLQLAWAISVHKAQGSQWSRVIIPVYKSRVLDRSLIYTAATRAQHQVVFLGSRDALNFAISERPAVSKRTCGFPSWLQLARSLRAIPSNELDA